MARVTLILLKLALKSPWVILSIVVRIMFVKVVIIIINVFSKILWLYLCLLFLLALLKQSLISELTLCMLVNFLCCWLFQIFFSKNFWEHYQSARRCGSRSGPTFCRSWSGSNLFAKVISRRQKSPLLGKELNYSISNTLLSYGVASGSEITPCNKICKPLVVYRFSGNVMTSITTLRT